MVNPVPSHPAVTTRYGKTGSWQAGYHTGEDYGSPGVNGAKVVATRTGKVVYSGSGGGWGPPYGQHVIIDSSGVRHMYAHLSSRSVAYGATVQAGQEIGRVGNTGNSSGPHCHYEERTGGFAYGKDDREPVFSKESGSGGGSGGGSGTTPVCFGDYCYGQNKDAHRALQRRLKEKGHDPGYGEWPTDYYGNGTKAAVAAFQTAQGWSGSGADGLMGPSTCDKLGLPQTFGYRSNKQVYASKMSVGTADSDSVWNVQVALLLKGYSIPNGPSNYFGEQTKAAVKEFQTKQGWTGDDADGIPGPSTVAALGLQWVQDTTAPVPPVVPPVTPPETPTTPPADTPPNVIWNPIPGFPGLRAFAPGGGPKVILHTTESDSKPNWEVQKSGIPHFTVDLKSGTIWQHLTLDMAAYTLKGGDNSPNSGAGVCIQVEIVGRAAQVPDWSADEYERLRRLLLWICSKIKAAYIFPFPWTGNSGYGVGGAVRQTWTAFRDASGIVGHSHVPYNDHWDPGALKVSMLTDRDETPPTPPVVEPEPPIEPPVEPPIEPPVVVSGVDQALRDLLGSWFEDLASEIAELDD